MVSVLCALGIAGCAGRAPEAARSRESLQRVVAEVSAEPGQGAPAAAPGAAADEAAAAEDAEAHDDGVEVDDDFEPPVEPGVGAAVHSPLASMTEAQIEELLAKDPAALGPMSLGPTNAGALFNGIRMPEDPRWELVDPNHAWGTRETVESLERAIAEVHRQYPGSPKLYIGHISARSGGRLSPHKSHQAGRDVDISYFLDARHRWYQRATAANLDRERTWAFVRALITETDVELILIDTSVQRLLKEHALKIGEDKGWLDEVFQFGSRKPRPLIRHARGHANHIHIRFYSPIAQESAVRAYPLLVKRGAIKPTTYYVRHTAKKGQTLGSLARQYGTTVEAIKRANGLRSTAIQAKRVYNIPRAGGGPAAPPLKHVTVPPRRLPPPRVADPSVPERRDDIGPALGG
ncbi:penicillin-insensitive murein endopeptidase [Sorangium cellulosum]|uniref:LysM peptidoglycan-binding domain-containing protein n=1 Tax=Sorangium cellulosum TaxID=56 RepID=UPI001F1C9EAC|nr:penicillin-insensitive murein endopeptidase [Sorangium cellulosum]